MIESLISHYGYKQGLTIKNNIIVEWPYEAPQPTKEELENFIQQSKEGSIVILLEQSCRNYQESDNLGACDSNLFSLMTSVKAVHKIAGTAPGQKAQENLDWLDSLWNECSQRKQNLTENYDFSQFGKIPNKFKEIREEIGE
jgi:hypothetical protein